MCCLKPAPKCDYHRHARHSGNFLVSPACRGRFKTALRSVDRSLGERTLSAPSRDSRGCENCGLAVSGQLRGQSIPRLSLQGNNKGAEKEYFSQNISLGPERCPLGRAGALSWPQPKVKPRPHNQGAIARAGGADGANSGASVTLSPLRSP